MQHDAGDYVIELKCARERPGRLYFSLARKAGPPFTAVAGVTLAIEQTGGRPSRLSIETINYGSYLDGIWKASGPALTAFQKGTALEVALNGGAVVLRTGMSGTGAARRAIRERCGF